MSGGEKVPWTRGMAVAQALLAALGPVYREARVAGSLRRGKVEVGDVELVLAPAFGGALDQRCDELLHQGVVTKRLNRLGRAIAWGDGKTPSRYKALTFDGLAVDLFIVQPDRPWGPTFLIRSGPGDANGVLVTPSGVRNRDGQPGVLPAGRKFEDGRVWLDGAPLDTPTELATFAACGLPWIAPPMRSTACYQAQAGFRAGDAADFRPKVLSTGERCDLKLDGWRPREDAIWTPSGECVFLDPALARPTVHGGQSEPVAQQELFA